MSSKVFDLGERQAQAMGKEAAAQNQEPANDGKRQPWNGMFSEAELDGPGGLLLAALSSCAVMRGHQLSQMSAELGVTYGYIAQLRNGHRDVSQISDDFATACAQYLMVPRMTVFMLAGRITAEDLFDTTDSAEREVSSALSVLCADTEWGPMVTQELLRSSLASRYLLVRLYERATGKSLMSKAVDMHEMAKEVAKLSEAQAARKAAGLTSPVPRKRGPKSVKAAD